MKPRQLLTAFYTLVRKEILRFLKMWPQTLLTPIVTVVLYFIIFGSFMGTQIGPILGLPYIDFIVPGLVMMTIVNSSFANVVGSFYISKFQREIEEQLVSPMPIWLIILGYICGGVARGIIAGGMVILVALFFWEPHFYSFSIIAIYIFLASLVFSLGGLLNGIFARKFDDIAMFASFVLIPLSYLGGVFFSIESLPPIWKSLSRLNPILYMMSGLRYGFYGVSDVGVPVGIAILILLASTLAVLNAYLLQRGIGIKE